MDSMVLGILGVVAYLGNEKFMEHGMMYGMIMDALEEVTKEAKAIHPFSRPQAILYMRQALYGMGLPWLDLMCAAKLYEANGVIEPKDVRFYRK